MLPRLPDVKSAVFTKRIVAYHETFATVGNKATKKRNISVVWHEGVAGRSTKEVTSAYMAALQKERDVEHVVYWVDNCSAQNKNWQCSPWGEQGKEDAQTGMKVVQLRRGSRSMYVKRAHGEEDFIECDFLQKKFSLQIPTTLRPADKGIEEAKKKDINIKTLCLLMPLTRRQFWSSLPVTLCQEE
ncbi:hypothetical protein SKAU_G00042660 [Synaphobranchus kaupii]|uniref:Uncharacterized protein n=1 Tax=Synaphobranchus kaupii TaxID=118154 RepID=A0A9Q1G285_SYNKA|nr:hypothetical protein SKAU_G00042660 [Synaphobranchus kaupii]